MIAKVSEIHGVYSKYNPTRAGKYIKLPLLISLKKACICIICISIKDQEDKCFKYAVQRGFLKIDENSHPTNVCHYKKTKDDLNFEGIKCQANNNHIARFEELNEHVSLNVFKVDDETGDVVRSRKLKSKMLNVMLTCKGLVRMTLVNMYVKKDCSRLLNSQKMNFMIGLTFVNIATVALELKNW